MKLLPLAACIALAALPIVAQKTTRRGLVTANAPAEAAQSITTVAYTDTIVAPEPHTVDINGYDKPLRSRREVFFVTNNSADTLQALSYTITYYDTKRRMLHKASHHSAVEIPAGETRQVSIKSWDPQFNFYYMRSVVPARASQATPYEVAIAVDTIFMQKLSR